MPSVAVVEGPAIGSGVEIAAACDFVVATPTASFRTPEALWGTVGATQRLARVIGKRLAKDMMFTGRALTADDAREAGLVARVVAPEALEATLEEIAATIAKAPASALALAKRCIDEGLERDPRGALATELMAIEESLAAAEWRRSMSGFGS
jgi:enoyl-CoA hydratase